MYSGPANVLLGETERSPKGFYRTTAKEAWPGIDPYMMSRAELDAQIIAGIKRYKDYFPQKGVFNDRMIATALIIMSMGAAAIAVGGAAAGSGAAAGGASAGSAAGSGATAATSSALAASGPQGGAWAAAGSSVTTATTTSSAVAFGKQIYGYAQQAAPYAKKAGALMKVAGNDDGDKLAKTADVVENSSSVTDAAEAVFISELKKRGMEYDEEKRAVLRERMKREQARYASYLRRRAANYKEDDPQVNTTGQKSMMNWLPLATPFVLYFLSR